jgi:FtsP/CotA-like multicopper oxidase with cupredoxin domain
MEPITRRNALMLGGVGAAAIIAGGAGLTWALTSGADQAEGPTLAEPDILRSTNGKLTVRLTAAEASVPISGTRVAALTYNGSLPGPTLMVRAGDRIAVSLQNRLSSPTNLHTHGLHVSPQGNSDNPLVRIRPGETFDYEFQLPDSHPPGVYWYHPHHHGLTADQVFGGLYGAIIVEDSDPIETVRERILIISDMSFDSSGQIAQATQMDRMAGREGHTVLVNGQVNPELAAKPGERERWRVINACTSRFLKLRLDGQKLQLLGKDSGRFRIPEPVDEVLLTPGNRADLLVTASAGTSILRTLAADRGSAGAMMGSSSSTDANLATLTVAGASAAAAPAVPHQSTPRDLRTAPLSGRRTLTFAMGAGGMGAGGMGGGGMGGGGMAVGSGMMGFTIDGKSFDPARVDTAVAAGAIEEWTLRNTSPMDHPFHLHVWPMQIIEQSSQKTATPLWQDVVNVPARGSVRVRIAFDDFTGKSVYHCHILDHEDNGMMGVIEVR